MTSTTGKSASRGLCRGKAYVYSEGDLSFERKSITDPDSEIVRFKAAVEASQQELSLLKEKLSESMGEEFGHIFRAQMTIAEDEDFQAEIIEVIRQNALCAEAALSDVLDMYAEAFSSMGEDDYNRQRLLDLRDVCNRILRNLLGIADRSLAQAPKGSIVLAEDLMPSDTAQMNTDHILGMATEKGGITSHVAILAKSLGIPAAVGVAGMLEVIKDGDDMVLDTRDFENAELRTQLDESDVALADSEIEKFRLRQAQIMEAAGLEAVTLDGHSIDISANIGSLDDVAQAKNHGAKSVGLLRTEFFFLDRDELPGEDEQFEFYKTVAEAFSPGMVVIRTLDIGGDKKVACLETPEEENPFLGVRGLRLCMKHPDVFRTQLRAILRAAAFGNIKVMLPMVSSLTEYRAVRLILTELSRELGDGNIEHDANLDLGIMVETPAAVMLADVLTQEAAFVSIGTNDLTQYLLCADRINSEVSAYYRTLSPAVFRAIGETAVKTRENGKWAGICGELGGVSMAIPALIGLGITELSMSAQLIPEAVSMIRSMTMDDCRHQANQILQMKTEEEIKEFLSTHNTR